MDFILLPGLPDIVCDQSHMHVSSQSCGCAHAGVAVYEAPSDMSKANGLLAEALEVKAFPTLQVPLCSLASKSFAFRKDPAPMGFFLSAWQFLSVPQCDS